MQPRGRAGKNWAAFRFGFAAHGHGVGKALPRLQHLIHRFGFVAGDIQADFAHGFDDDRIERAGRQSGTVGFKPVAAKVIEPRFGHLAAGAVVDADEQDFLFHGLFSLGATR